MTAATPRGNLNFTCDGKPLIVRTLILSESAVPAETYRMIAIPAASAQASPQWETIDQFGSQGQVVRSKLDLPSIDPADAIKTVPLVYKFTSATAVGGQMQIVLLPTRPLHPGLGVRIAVKPRRRAAPGPRLRHHRQKRRM